MAKQRRDLGTTSGDAELIAAALVRENFRRLTEVFGESVLGADQGLVNVAWSQWVEVTDERDRVTGERNSVIRDLERRFQFLSQKMSQ